LSLQSDLAVARAQAERLEAERTTLLRRAEAGEYLGVQLNAQLDGVRGELERTHVSASGLQAVVDRRDERILAMETTLATTADEMRVGRAALSGRDERVRRLEQSLAERDERLRAVESELAELSGRIVELEGRSIDG